MRLILTLLFIWFSYTSVACTCVGNGKATIQQNVKNAVLTVHGIILREEVYNYVDSTISYLDEKGMTTFHKGREKMYTMVITDVFKVPYNTPDTIKIITGFGGGDCGFEFQVGKSYIVYGKFWKERNSDFYRGSSREKFWTDICWPTELSNAAQLAELKSLGPQPRKKYDLRLELENYPDTIFRESEAVLKFKVVNDSQKKFDIIVSLDHFELKVFKLDSKQIFNSKGRFYVSSKATEGEHVLNGLGDKEFTMGFDVQSIKKMAPGIYRFRIIYLADEIDPEMANPASDWIDIYIPPKIKTN